MAEVRDTVIDWLRDAHAMEEAAIHNLEKNVDRFKAYPEMERVFRQDLEESRHASAELKQSLQRLGTDNSALKDAGMKFAGAIQPFMAGMSGDDVVKHLLAAQAYKHFEVASFRSLAAAAETLGDAQIKALCERSGDQKKAVAARIEENLPRVTQAYLAQAH